jgi:hypothetical protein
VIKGSVKVVDERGQVIPPRERAEVTAEMARSSLREPALV